MISKTLADNLKYLKASFGEYSDLTVREFLVGGTGAAIVSLENMVDKDMITQSVILPLRRYGGDFSADGGLKFVSQNLLAAAEQADCFDMDEVKLRLASGFALLFFDSADFAVAIGAQGFSVRSISEPSGEAVLRGSREGFTESAKNNVSMLRRRIRSDDLRFENLRLGNVTNTDAYLCYIQSKASPKILSEIRKRISQTDMDSVLETGYIQPYLECGRISPFSTVGSTERPDAVCGKLMEGRAAILVDGTPFALVVPHLFAENFQTIDDYTSRPYYAFLIRLFKYISFFLTIFLPGLYVAVGTFHTEMLSDTLFYNVLKAEATTPLTLMSEAVIIHLVFEIVKEAGLRLPQPIGQAVSIVGGLVLGDTAISSGLIGAPMVIVVALSAITGFVIPSLAQPVVLLRFIGIIAAGLTGMFGIVMLLALTFINLCSLDSIGVPYFAPVSPFNKTFRQDVLFRIGWKKLSRRGHLVQDLEK
ncbi:MAG: spore germination protein [Clostridia bacterium]|nr:spore germination protein [Clostridia bacterium]